MKNFKKNKLLNNKKQKNKKKQNNLKIALNVIEKLDIQDICANVIKCFANFIECLKIMIVPMILLLFKKKD